VSEFGFANDSIPISVATFSRESKPDIIAISNIYEDNSHTFNPFQKTQGHPDVSECLDSTPLLLRIVLDGTFTTKALQYICLYTSFKLFCSLLKVHGFCLVRIPILYT